MPNHIKSINLTVDDKDTLESILQQSTVEARKYVRAKILLLKDKNNSNEYIAEKLDITVPTVRLCIEKYSAGGIENALNDCKGRGRKAEISDADITWVINKACQKPRDYGYSAELWYPSSFTRFIRSIAIAEGHPRLENVSEYALRQILDKAKIRPFKIKYYCEKRDPNFDTKMHDVLVVYKQIAMQFDEEGKLKPFDGTPVHTLSYDEKPGIQAVQSTTEDRPPVSNTNKKSSIMRDCEYIRHGTLSLLAAIDLLTGEAIPRVSATHKSSDFVSFLKLLDDKYPNGDKVRLILDNHSAHTSKETQEYLNTVPGRFEFVFTPTHGSWLNMVEGFFSKLTKQMLNGIRVSNKTELEQRIYQYFEEINKVPVPYHWSYKLDDIDLEKEDLDQIVYEVVNHKAAASDSKELRVPEPIRRGRKKKSGQPI
jgi:transposase